MRLDQLHYDLPPELVARHPSPRRDDARLLVVGDEGLEHRRVRDLVALVPAGSLVVVNDTRVVPARLFGRKESGGQVEILLVQRLDETHWTAMGRASRRFRAGTAIELGGLVAVVEGESDAEGLLTLRFEGDVERVISEHGTMPLPPYLDRPATPEDWERYQTVFAREPGAVAAPTAGLHFSEELLAGLERAGIERTAITLHVGPGTFRPVKVDDLAEHPMHAESYEISSPAAEAIARARRRGARVVAIGTTVVRALESAADPARPGLVIPQRGCTRLLIQPGHRFRVVDALMTNFHLPGSTLLALVYAFGGTKRVARAYQAAISERYRFYSYGDAMYLAARAPHGAEAR